MAGRKGAKMGHHKASTKTGSFKRDAGGAVITPLNKGQHAYVVDPDSPKSLHVATDSEAFVDAVKALVVAGYVQEVRESLDELGWDEQLVFLETSGCFDVEVTEPS